MPHRSFRFIMSKTDHMTFPPQVCCSFWIKHSIIFSLSSKSRPCHVLILLFIMPLSKWIWTSVDPTFSLSLPLLSWHSNSLAPVQDIIPSYLVFCHRSLIDYPDSSLPLPHFPQSTTHPTASRVIFLKCKPYRCLAENSKNSCYRMRLKLFNISYLAFYALASTFLSGISLVYASLPAVLRTCWILLYPWALLMLLPLPGECLPN